MVKMIRLKSDWLKSWEHVGTDDKSPPSRQNKMLGLNAQISMRHVYHINISII